MKSDLSCIFVAWWEYTGESVLGSNVDIEHLKYLTRDKSVARRYFLGDKTGSGGPSRGFKEAKLTLVTFVVKIRDEGARSLRRWILVSKKPMFYRRQCHRRVDGRHMRPKEGVNSVCVVGHLNLNTHTRASPSNPHDHMNADRGNEVMPRILYATKIPMTADLHCVWMLVHNVRHRTAFS
jgi:hypothetical protein